VAAYGDFLMAAVKCASTTRFFQQGRHFPPLASPESGVALGFPRETGQPSRSFLVDPELLELHW
jgi:hypothetical protein